MTDNQKVVYQYLQSIGSLKKLLPVDFFLMVQDTALTIQECSLTLDELESMRIVDTKNVKKLTTFKLLK